MKLLGVVFTGSVLATCSAVTAVSLDVSSMAKDAPTVTKTVFSSKMRLVFAVGVEGTGHGFVNQVNDHMFNTNDQLVAIPRVDTVSAGRYYIFISMRSDVHHYNAVLDNAREQMQNLAKRAAELPFPGTMVLMQGKSSYPVGWGPNKVMKYLDLRMLAEVAEEKGVDFRVLYLQRSVKDMIIANTVHRSFQNASPRGDQETIPPEVRYMKYMQLLLTDTAVVHSFLAELDPAFVICHDYSRVGDVEQASVVADFIAPNADVAEPLQASFVAVAKDHGASNQTLPYEGAEIFASRLQRKFDAFESRICTSR